MKTLFLQAKKATLCHFCLFKAREIEAEHINTHPNESLGLWLAFFICEQKMREDGHDIRSKPMSKRLENDLRIFMRYS